MQNLPPAPTPAESSPKIEPVKRIIRSRVPDSSAGMRIDRYLAERFTYLTCEKWGELVTDGFLRVSGLKVRPSRVLQGGEILEFTPPPGREEPPVNTDYQILLDTENFLAVSKPPCLPVHPAGIFFNHTLTMMLRHEYGVLHPVNRLDRETSGILLLAKDPESTKKLSALFQNHRIRKQYIAAVHGVVPETWRAEGVLFSDPASVIRKKQKFTADPHEGSHCVTIFHREGCNDCMSVVRCLPETGHFHQIRATLYSQGFPLAGDKLYGLDETMFLRHAKDSLTDADLEKLILPHQALHASDLTFRSPFTGETCELHAPCPADMQALIDRITRSQGSLR